MNAAMVLIGMMLGAALGVAHFLSLRRVSADYLGGHGARAVGLQVLRMGLAGVVFYGLARWGAAALLGGALGFVVARAGVMRRLRGAP